MDDKFTIHIPETIDAKMSAWELPADILRLMEDRLRNDLAYDPAKKLVPCMAPWEERLNLFSFIIPDTDQKVNHLFMFHFVYGEDESSLIMVECGYGRHTQLPDAPGLPGS